MERPKIQNVEIKSIIFDIVLTFLTLGIWNLYVQIRQIHDVNDLLGEERFSFLAMLILSLLTLGLFFCYHEYSLTRTLHQMNYKEQFTFNEVMMGILAFFGLWIVVDSYQQMLINKYIETNSN